MKKLIPAAAAAALVAGAAVGSALAFPPSSPMAPPMTPPAMMEPAAFGVHGGPHMGPQHGPDGRHVMPAHARGDQRGPDHKGPQRGASVEERAERLKERLKITDAQAPQWKAVVDVMREQYQAFASSQAEVWQRRAAGDTSAMTLPQRLAQRDKDMASRVENQRKLTQAFTALYNTMNDEQKKIADDLLSGRGHRR